MESVVEVRYGVRRKGRRVSLIAASCAAAASSGSAAPSRRCARTTALLLSPARGAGWRCAGTFRRPARAAGSLSLRPPYQREREDGSRSGTPGPSRTLGPECPPSGALRRGPGRIHASSKAVVDCRQRRAEDPDETIAKPTSAMLIVASRCRRAAWRGERQHGARPGEARRSSRALSRRAGDVNQDQKGRWRARHRRTSPHGGVADDLDPVSARQIGATTAARAARRARRTVGVLRATRNP
mgnify:CR=1 FL=1